ncbi:MAG TPA: aspartate carbamoyltransferase catalytic subunit [Herpetosiphon sp.]|uniref:Aspartate carbamoyltransferase n=1 Tax=Herpetosiphon aurantiacus (strain ATCC 23779 / DSM 785 / 114-95) TaxID=316274 RepID=A9AVM4_HERA2|nr:aspartate carbamoyltransferase catalytic subunit [Herpetosiphon sp.]ABX06624.1 aspartate carbamoyltransferase [Herpetosiphon aurantiacus DSM 785]MCA0354165.1 aspartate carbamoyltransferase catalytic subunit [Chloroflexota bacterium]HBW49289.1 aspartate carbamoyltransferase catalytic subunit [Herpetosiphon sp.]
MSSPTTTPRRRHVLDLDDWSADELRTLLTIATQMKDVLERPVKQVPTLRGKIVVNMFWEDSTRTRSSFELAAKALSANVLSLGAKDTSVKKGESLVDTVRTVQALGADYIVMRHGQSGSPYLVAQHFRGSVINGGDGRHAHPSQALLDLFTMHERLGELADKKVVIVGDILHSRVARSNLWALTTMGAKVVVCGPPTLIGPAKYWQSTWPNVEISHSLDQAAEGADVLMALRLQHERMEGGLLPSLREYSRRFGLNATRVASANSNVIVMHPGPMNEGVEIMPDVATGPHSVIETQITNGVAMRMALFYYLATGSEQV